MLGTRTLLGLAIDEFGIVAAEVAARAGRPEVRRVGQLTFEGKLSAETAKDLGQQLRHFLRANHFSSRHAVVGIPTKWIVAKEIVAPPASADAVAGMLGIQAERAFSLNASDLIFDYFGRTSTFESSKVMLLAARREIVSDVRELTTAAGLQVRCVTVSALAFGKILSGSGPEARYGLYARPTYCEFWSQANGQLRSIKHVPMASANGTTPDRAEQLTSAIQRLVLLSGEQDQAPPHQVIVYDGDGRADGLLDRLNTQLRPQITVSDGRAGLMAGPIDLSEGSEGAQSIAAAAVAMAGAGPDRPPVDFLNPRIGRKKTSGRKRVTSWAVVAAIIGLAAVGAVVADWQIKRSDIATHTQSLEGISEEIAAAKKLMEQMQYAASWTSQKPVFLDCLRELTNAFPEYGTVWATSLNVSDTGQGLLVGRANTQANYYEVLNQLQQNPAFANVMQVYLREAGGSARQQEFAIKFEFKGVK
ncbi:MAG: hypothetical protein JW993_08220 [Sedimentisphaerales bacterium]|nr:hypothetical protein [Sedimentisphaerales bacterium]